jgi:hypothetical protein
MERALGNSIGGENTFGCLAARPNRKSLTGASADSSIFGCPAKPQIAAHPFSRWRPPDEHPKTHGFK